MDEFAARPESNGLDPEPASAPLELPEPPDPPTLERAESLIRQARLARQRGQSDLVFKLLEEAKDVAPGAGIVWEAIGDEAAAAHQSRKAREAYTMAWRLSPKDPNIERKYAETVLASSAFFSPELGGVTAYPKSSIWASVMLPGLGQVLNEEYGKGLVMMTGWLGSLFFSKILQPETFKSLINFRFHEVSMITFVCMLGMLICFVWSIYDISRNTFDDRLKKPANRPVPPVDKPFEL